LITDNYSKMIVVFCLYPTLESEGCIHALTMALKTREKAIDLIHHSDRGIQYCSSAYVEILKSSTISISMTNTGSPYENAAAERVNGILKTEFGLNKTFRNRNEALKTVKKSIITYNTKRPHASCDYLTPQEAHAVKGKLKKRWKSS
jgi:transposase InsO family protein